MKKNKVKFFQHLLFVTSFFCSVCIYAENDSLHSTLKEIEILAILNNAKTPMTFQNISKKNLNDNNQTQDLPFVLQQTSSLVAYSDAGNGAGYTGLRIRGSDLTRINVTLNGVPYNDAEGQGVYFVDIPDIAKYSESIQIQRGVGASSNGGSAFGGGINFSTAKIFKQRPSIEYNFSSASFNTQKHNLAISSGLMNKKWHADIAASITKSDGYVDRAASDVASIFSSIAYQHNEKLQLKFNYLFGKEKTYHAWKGVVDTLLEKQRTFNSAGIIIDDYGYVRKEIPYPNQTDNYTQHHFQFLYTQKFNDKLSLNNTLFTSLGKGYYEEYKNGSVKPYFKNDADYIRQLWLDNIFYGNLLSLNFQTERSKINVGINAQRYEGKHYGYLLWVDQKPEFSNTKYYQLTANKNDFNGFIKLEQRLNKKISVYADLQWRHVDYQMNGFRKQPDTFRQVNYFFINPKMGLSYETQYIKGFASYSIGQKEPNRSDFENRRDIPKPELLNDIEIGTTIHYQKFQYTNILFGMFYKNQLILDGSIDDVGNYLRQNIAESYRIGVENEVSYEILPSLNISSNFTLSSNKISHYENKIIDYDTYEYRTAAYSKTDISFSPNIISAYQIVWKPIVNLDFMIKGKYVGKQYIDNTSDDNKSLKNYYLQDFLLSYALNDKMFHRELKRDIFSAKITLGINNIFNKLYEANAYNYAYYSSNLLYANNYYYPMMGINYFMKLEIGLNR